MSGGVLVTGGYGFIGSHVVKALLTTGVQIRVIDAVPEGNAADEVLTEIERTAVGHVGRTIPSVAGLVRLIREHALDAIVHLASPLSSTTERSPQMSVDGMVAPQMRLLEGARRGRLK